MPASSLPETWFSQRTDPLSALVITPLKGIPIVKPGDDLVELLLDAARANHIQPQAGDVLVLAQKIVSKAEGRYRSLRDVTPSPQAIALAEKTHKDPRLVELVLEESTDIVRAVPGVLIVRHRHGHVMANAGIDASNLSAEHGEDDVLLLPENADHSAAQLRQGLVSSLGFEVAVVISDSFGRPWRNGVSNVAIGVAGLPALLDKRNETDMIGRTLRVTQVAVGDLVASAAGLMMGEADEAIPATWINGLPAHYHGSEGNHSGASTLVRPLEEDLFR